LLLNLSSISRTVPAYPEFELNFRAKNAKSLDASNALISQWRASVRFIDVGSIRAIAGEAVVGGFGLYKYGSSRASPFRAMSLRRRFSWER